MKADVKTIILTICNDGEVMAHDIPDGINVEFRNYDIDDEANYDPDDLRVDETGETYVSRTQPASRTPSASERLTEIHGLLDGREWSSETASDIADVLRAHGLTVRDVE